MIPEVLATTWKEKRAEINKLQKQRRFTDARDLRRSFRVEIEEMKRTSAIAVAVPAIGHVNVDRSVTLLARELHLLQAQRAMVVVRVLNLKRVQLWYLR